MNSPMHMANHFVVFAKVSLCLSVHVICMTLCSISLVIYIYLKKFGQLQSLKVAVLNCVSSSGTNCKFGAFMKSLSDLIIC